MFLLFTHCLSIAHLDDNQRNGVNYLRYANESSKAILPKEKPEFSEVLDNFEYIHPSGNKPQATDKTLVLVGSYLTDKTVSVQFELFSEPDGAVLIFDSNIVIGNEILPTKPCNSNPQNSTKRSGNFTFYEHKYHQIAIIHNIGCSDQLRSVSLKARINGEGDFNTLDSTKIFTFETTECREGYYGPTCSGNCTNETMCNNNGRCSDGMAGTGKCECLSGYLGEFCNDICNPAKHCSGNGRCLGDGSCQCFTGYSGNNCADFTDINLGSKAGIAILFYAICSAGFLCSSIYQNFKMENSNPIAHICLLIFSLLKLASAFMIKANKTETLFSDILSLLPVAILAFVCLRSITLIQNQFKTTSPDFSFKLLHVSVIILPIVIAIFAICGPILMPKHMIWSVALPFVICAMYTFFFSIFALYCGMKDPFEKMHDIFPNLASELYASRRYVVCASLFFIFDTFLAWYQVDTNTEILGLNEYAYYALLIIDVFTILCIGLANDTVLSDIFAIEDDDGGFIPMGFATVSDIDDDPDQSSNFSSNAMFAPLYSSCPNAYKSAEKKFKKEKSCCTKRLAKILISILIVFIIVAVILIIYINPTYPVWSLDGMQFSGKDIKTSDVYLAPNISIHNPMRAWMDMNNVKISLVYKNVTIGKNNSMSNRISGNQMTRVTSNISVNLHSKEQETGKDLISDLITGDGIMELLIKGEAYPLVWGIIKLTSKVSCTQSIRVLDGMQIVDGCGRCEYTENSFSLNIDL